ncbi:MAG: SDR family NAD(P)-dependent oxidoreductase, partial [Epsilonproteobacteria bacterium]|nr:SDR family NAD(P)-dependent oxidoreductase [Campylobacterota bacterium]
MATAIVTGSSSGIGKAIVQMLLEENYSVIG